MHDKAIQYCMQHPFTFGMSYFFNSVATFILYELFSWWFVASRYFPTDAQRHSQTLRVMHYARVVLILNIGIGLWMARNGIW